MSNEFIRFVEMMNQMKISGDHIDLTKVPDDFLISKEEMSKMSGHIYSQIHKKMPNKCLFPGCNNKAILSHSIQRSLLETIADKTNHVYRFSVKAEFTYDGRVETVIEKVGINKASTFEGYCNQHDTNLFLPIENQPIQSNNLEQQFLLLMRALNKEYYDSRNAYFNMRDTVLPLLKNFGEHDLRGPYFLTQIYLQFCEYFRIENLKNDIDTLFLQKIYTYPFSFGSKIVDMKCPVFVSTFFALQGSIGNKTYNIDITQDLPYYFSLTILPIGNNQTGIFYAYIDEQKLSIKDFLLNFDDKDINNLQIFLTDTILRNSQNFYLSSSKFESMTLEEQNEMKKLFYHTITNRNYQNNNYPNFFI